MRVKGKQLRDHGYFLFSIRMSSDTFLPPATKLGQGYVFTRVYDSVHGGSALVHTGNTSPPGDFPACTEAC